MKAGHWLALVAVFIVGVILGFGMGANPGKVAGLESRIQELTAENAQLKSRPMPPPAPSPTPAAAPAKP